VTVHARLLEMRAVLATSGVLLTSFRLIVLIKDYLGVFHILCKLCVAASELPRHLEALPRLISA
jgi:hypothetical protein